MTELVAPTPRYAIGDVVYVPWTDTETRKHDCPDCLNTRKWKVITPAGTELETTCIRCSSNYGPSDLRRLDYRVTVGRAQARRITGIKLTARPSSWASAVEYECDSDGSGSSYSYGEGKVYATEAQALAIAEAEAVAINAEAARKPERLADLHSAALRFNDARFDEFKNGLWDAWYRYRDLREKIEEAMAPDGKSLEQVVEDLTSDMRWTLDYHDRHAGGLEAVVRAAEAVAAADPSSPIATALAGLPRFQRDALAGKDLDECELAA